LTNGGASISFCAASLKVSSNIGSETKSVLEFKEQEQNGCIIHIHNRDWMPKGISNIPKGTINQQVIGKDLNEQSQS
jgi:hypothetical protein